MIETLIIVAASALITAVLIPVGMDYFKENKNGSDRQTDQEIRSDSDQRADAGGGPIYAAGPSGTIALTPIAGAGSPGACAGAGVMWPLPSNPPPLTTSDIVQMALSRINAQSQLNAVYTSSMVQNVPGPYQSLAQLAAQQSSFQHQIALQNAMLYGGGAYLGMDFAAPARIVENAGIVLGEIEGYRAWRIFNGCLVSLYVDDVWLPGEPMTATDVREDNTNGAHAFKTPWQAEKYANDPQYPNVAIGRVKLWGQIIEHELGYRAEFSKPIQILSVRWHKLGGAVGTVEEIAKRYGIPVGKPK